MVVVQHHCMTQWIVVTSLSVRNSCKLVQILSYELPRGEWLIAIVIFLACRNLYWKTNFFFRTFSGKTPYDLSRKKQSLHCFLQRFISNFMLNENEPMHSPTTSFAETNFCQKSLSSNMSQLSVESNKSSDPVYDLPSRDTGKESPKSIADKESIYNLLWPQPKVVVELKNFTAPFIAGKELFISIIQVILLLGYQFFWIFVLRICIFILMF